VTSLSLNDLPFDEIWAVDFEFVAKPGEHYDVVCLAAVELRSGRTIQLRRDQMGPDPPYRTDAGALFCCFVASAELGSHLSLGWPLPKAVLDLSPAFRNIVNGRTVPEGKGLLGALRYFGHDTMSAKKKDGMRKRILAGPPFTDEELAQIQAYCLEDVLSLQRLLPHILADPEFDLGVALYHGEFVATLALMEFRGVPIDQEIFNQLADKETWRAIRDAMVPTIDADYGVYVRGPDGDWSFNTGMFLAYLEREGIVWPLLESGKPDLKEKTFSEMGKGYPQLEPLRQLRHVRNKMRKVKLAVGADGRNRTVLWPFQAKTSRTQPKASQWIFSPAVWLRSLIMPAPGMAVAYIDYSSMEFLGAASLSDGHCGPHNPMLEMYNSGDPYLSFAKKIGAVPLTATRKTHAATRDKYKAMLLAVQYGMSYKTLAARLGVSDFEAHEMLNQHKEVFAQYWAWSDDWVQHSLQTGVMRTAFGWTCRTGITEFNERMIRNWPIQATCADILRIACILATRHHIRLLAPVHDAVLIEAPAWRIEQDTRLMQELMRRASRIVLNKDSDGTHELRTDAVIVDSTITEIDTSGPFVRYPVRYRDARGDQIWAQVMKLLEQQKRRAAA
jgi:hypothetical protein